MGLFRGKVVARKGKYVYKKDRSGYGEWSTPSGNPPVKRFGKWRDRGT